MCDRVFSVLTRKRREHGHTWRLWGEWVQRLHSWSDNSRAGFTHMGHGLPGQMPMQEGPVSSWTQYHHFWNTTSCQKRTIQKHCKASNMDCIEVWILISHQITRVFSLVIVNHEGLQLAFTPQFEFISQYLCTSLSTSWTGKFLGDKPQNQNYILFDNFRLELNCYFTLILFFYLILELK